MDKMILYGDQQRMFCCADAVYQCLLVNRVNAIAIQDPDLYSFFFELICRFECFKYGNAGGGNSQLIFI